MEESENRNRDGDEHDATGGDDQLSTSKTSSMLSCYNSQQPWFQPAKDTWPPTFPSPGPNASISNDLNAESLASWAESSRERGPAGCVLSIVESEGASHLLPTTRGPQVPRFSGVHRHDVDQGDGTASSLTSQLPTSTRLSRADRVSDLRSYLSKEPLTTQRLVDVYFSKGRVDTD